MMGGAEQTSTDLGVKTAMGGGGARHDLEVI